MRGLHPRWASLGAAALPSLALLVACPSEAPPPPVEAAPQAPTPAPEKAEEGGMPTGLDATAKADWVLSQWNTLQRGEGAVAYASLQVEGRVNYVEPALFGDIKVITKGTDKAYTRVTFRGGLFAEEGYDGKQGWQRATGQKVRALSREELAARRGANLLWSDFRERYKSRKYASIGEVDGRPAHRLELTDDDGNRQVLYLDAKTFELIKVRSVPVGDEGATVILFKDYRRVNGSLEPFSVRIESPEGTREIQIFEIKRDVDVRDSQFAPPSP